MTQKENKILFPEKRVASIGFILNAQQQLLLVKPSYYEFWHLPGGYVDENESPLQAVIREINEEINLSLKPHRLMLVDYDPGNNKTKEVIVFVFDFGLVDQSDFDGLQVDNSEIIDFGFFDQKQALELVGPDRSKRLELCYQAMTSSDIYYLNNSIPFPGE